MISWFIFIKEADGVLHFSYAMSRVSCWCQGWRNRIAENKGIPGTWAVWKNCSDSWIFLFVILCERILTAFVWNNSIDRINMGHVEITQIKYEVFYISEEYGLQFIFYSTKMLLHWTDRHLVSFKLLDRVLKVPLTFPLVESLYWA